MTFLPNLLASLAEGLAENGSRFGAMPLADIAAVLSFLRATGHDNDAEMNAATLGSVLLPAEQARALAHATALSSDLVPDLQPVPLLGVDPQLATLVARAQPRQAAVAATLLFALYHRAARAGNLERVSQLRTWIDGLLPEEGNPELITVLQAQTRAVKIAEGEPPKPGQRLFSISIDLVGSTDAKTRVMKLAAGDGRRIDAFNARIYQAFCSIEEAFYRHAAGKYGEGSPVGLDRFFAVKGIGDEIWLLCEVLRRPDRGARGSPHRRRARDCVEAGSSDRHRERGGEPISIRSQLRLRGDRTGPVTHQGVYGRRRTRLRSGKDARRSLNRSHPPNYNGVSRGHAPSSAELARIVSRRCFRRLRGHPMGEISGLPHRLYRT